MVGRPPGFAPRVRRSFSPNRDRRHGLGRARASRPETGSDTTTVRRHPERLRPTGPPRPGDRLGARGGCFGACDTPRIPSRDGPLGSHGSAGVRTAGLRVVPTAPTATTGVGRVDAWLGQRTALSVTVADFGDRGQLMERRGGVRAPHVPAGTPSSRGQAFRFCLQKQPAFFDQGSQVAASAAR